MKKIKITLTLLALLLLTPNCSSVGNTLNPLSETPSPIAYAGNKTDHALNQSSAKVNAARKALEAMATYRRAQLPQPNYPVVQPAVIRVMWVPDHLNSHGDLVPAHYYYLKVLGDRWAVQDAFELEKQLHRRSTFSGANTGLSFVAK
ncbi:MAG: hypothetical protein D6780_05855 [Candidatus Dadabacteria bacterium]|nr:MAG: hypothetical protein D6780_05855 [Candidatus Dadabacteria bacterium]